jgi:hypothetical protein
MTQLFTNNASSTLAAAITAAATTLTLAAGDGAKFPNPQAGDDFLITVFQRVGTSEQNWEVMLCSARAGDVLTVARAQEGSTARAYGTGDFVECRLTAAAILPTRAGALTGALNEAAPVAIASSASVAIGAAKSNTVNVTGTTTITAFDAAPIGAIRRTVFAGALTLTHNAASMILIAGANIVTAAGDVAEWVSLGSGNWRMFNYSRANGDSVGTVSVAKGGTGATTAAGALSNLGIPNVENKSSATIRGELTAANVTTALTYTPPSQAPGFAQGAANMSLRAVDYRLAANPLTSLGYASGGRFRFGSMNEDNAVPYADVIDLSTYTDSTGGGVNALYMSKVSQYIVHKFAGAGATSWISKALAYLSDVLPLVGGTLTGTLSMGNGANIAPRVSDPFASITAINSAPIDNPLTTVTSGAGSFTPMIRQRTQINGAGYIQHVVFGSYRPGTAAWGGAAFVGIGGSDASATEYFTLNYGGEIGHSSGKTFLNTGNVATYAGTKANPQFTGNITTVQPSGTQATLNLNCGTMQAQFYFRDMDKNAGIWVNDGAVSYTRLRFAGPTGAVSIAEAGGGNVTIGTATDDGSNKLQVAGQVAASSYKARLGAGSLSTYSASSYFVQPESASVVRSYSSGADAGTWGQFEHYSTSSTGTPRLVYAAMPNGFFLVGSTTDDGSGARLQSSGSISATGALVSRGGDTSWAIRSQNTSASNSEQYYVKHNLAAVEIGNVRGAITLTSQAGTAPLYVSASALQLNGSNVLTQASTDTLLKRRVRYNTADGTTLNNAGLETGFVYAPAGADITGPFLSFGGLNGAGDYMCQLVSTYNNSLTKLRMRSLNGDSGTWNGWVEVLTDQAPTIYKPTIQGYVEKVQTLTSGAGGLTLNPDNGTLIYVDLTANTTITLPAAVAGLSYTLVVNYNGGNWTLTFAGGTSIRWSGGTAPTATSVSGKYDKYVFTCLSGVTLGQDGGRNF